MKTATRFFIRFLKQEAGVTAVECALMLALVVVVCIVAINRADPNVVSSEPVIVHAIEQ